MAVEIAEVGEKMVGRLVRTCLTSCFVFRPAPYQAPVTVVAKTPAVRIMVRALGALDMVLGALSIAWFEMGRREKGEDSEPRRWNSAPTLLLSDCIGFAGHFTQEMAQTIYYYLSHISKYRKLLAKAERDRCQAVAKQDNIVEILYSFLSKIFVRKDNLYNALTLILNKYKNNICSENY